MSEPTPRQKRTVQLLDEAKKAHREIAADLQFLRQGAELGGVLDVQVLLVLVRVAAEQHQINRHLIQVIDNIAGSLAFNQESK